MEFFGFCEGAFNCLLAPGVNALTVKCLRKRIRLFQIILPNMARHQPSCHTGGKAFFSARTVTTDFAVTPIFPVAGAVGGFPCQFMLLWTKVNVFILLVNKMVFAPMLSLVCVPAVANNRLNSTRSDLVTSWCIVVSCIHTHIAGQMTQTLLNVIQYIRHRINVIHIGGCNSYIDNNVVLAVYGTVLTVMKSIRLAFFMQLSTFWIVLALLNLCGWRLVIVLLLKGLLSQSISVRCNGCIQFFHVCFRRLLNGYSCFLVFICLGFDVSGVGVQDFTSHQFLFHCLSQYFLKNLFCNVIIPEPPCPIDADRCSIRCFLGQPQTTKPFVGKVVVDFFLQSPFRADAVQIAYKQHTEQNLRVYCRTTYVFTVQWGTQLVNE